jgi:NAD dependent epimerase/dehydratase family enzyme
MPWVSLEDWIRAVSLAVTEDFLSGPVIVAGPTPATNAEFTAEFGRILKRPTIMPLPRLPLRVVIGEFADEAFKSFRAIPEALNQAGFGFHHETVGEALEAGLKR